MAQLNFKGKPFVWNYHQAVPHCELIPQPDKSLTDSVSLNDNLIIHGDNLKALKALLPTYAGKVKCIYIDPPYNTGNEGWAYNDNVNSPMMQEWLGKVVDREDLTRHDKWLCMMTPRLRLLRELLSEDGTIFISIDDNELHRLRILMDEIFGDSNFIETIIWHKSYAPKSSALHFSTDHDYIVLYARDTSKAKISLLERTEAQDKLYKNPDNDPRGLWRPNNFAARNFYSKGTYSITTPGGRVVTGPPKGLYWRSSLEKLQEMDKDGRIWWGKDGNNIPAPKIYLSEVMGGRIPQSIWSFNEVGHTQEAKREILSLIDFGDSADVFISPKPTRLIERIVQISTETDSIVLDSFAGSGTTAQAVLAQNREDGGSRKFILVECEDYADKLTAERVRRVIKGSQGEGDEYLETGLGGSFSYFELGKPIELESLLSGEHLPNYHEMARYVLYSSTGQEFDDKKLDEEKHLIGSTKEYDVYMWYGPDLEYLKNTAFTLDDARAFGPFTGRKRLVFAPAKFLDQEQLDEYHIEFAQLPFEIYRRAK